MRFIPKKTIGTVSLYVNDKFITSKTFKSIQDRKDIMNVWQDAFVPLNTELVYFQISHFYSKTDKKEQELKKLEIKGRVKLRHKGVYSNQKWI